MNHSVRVLIASVALAVSVGCASALAASASASTSHFGPAWAVSQAKGRLSGLRVKSAGSMSGYSRDKFGTAWKDVNHNGCDTRNDILNRDLTAKVWNDSKHCEVKTGTLRDRYTGKTIHFVRGVGTSLAVQIDHMVALGDAWRTGARRWTAAKRLAYANDPRVLIAVDGRSNEQKSDDDAASWLPANKAFRCQYVADQVDIKATYGLWVTPAEKSTMKTVLQGC